VGLIVLSPTVLVDLLHQKAAIFPLRNPAIVSMSGAFIAGAIASLLSSEPRALTLYDEEKLRVYLGVGAE
jgi:cation/acetate symporter